MEGGCIDSEYNWYNKKWKESYIRGSCIQERPRILDYYLLISALGSEEIYVLEQRFPTPLHQFLMFAVKTDLKISAL
jgi:hypothetical protein